MIDRNFKGVWIPKEIYLNKELNWIQKILFIEIDSYTRNEMKCFFSNAYLSEFLGISERQVTENISKLKKLGYIKESGFDGRKRYLESLLKYCVPDKNFSSIEGRGKLLVRQEENFQHTNIDTNITTKSDNKEKSAKAPTSFKKPQKEEVLKTFQEKLQDTKRAIIETEKFFNHYESVGWKVGRNPMKNWRASIAGWVSRMGDYGKTGKQTTQKQPESEKLTAYTWESVPESVKKNHSSKQAYEEMYQAKAKAEGKILIWEEAPWSR